MDFSSGSPIYLQVINELQSRMITGALRPGDKLPSSRELALEFTINPNTAARVYSEMEALGLVFTRRGLGTFVTEDEEKLSSLKAEHTNEIIRDFVQKMKRLGYSPADIPSELAKFMDTKGDLG